MSYKITSMIINFVDTRDFVDNFAVKALTVKDMDKKKWCRVQGNQLRLALKDPALSKFYNDEGWYYFVNDDFATEWREL